jgi:hypothetical protein
VCASRCPDEPVGGIPGKEPGGKRNLHHPQAALAAEFAPSSRTGPEALGWETPLEAYRPFLSYNELGSLLDEGPSKLYDRPDSRMATMRRRSSISSFPRSPRRSRDRP